MDDTQFDDLIKSKFEGHEVEGFDPAALASLHLAMASSVHLPWYTRFRSELVTVSSVLVVGTLLMLIQWRYFETSKQLILQENALLSDQLAQMRFMQVRNETTASSKPETPISHGEDPDLKELVSSLTLRLDALENSQTENASFSRFFWIGSTSEIPAPILDLLEKYQLGYIVKDQVYLVNRIETMNLEPLPPLFESPGPINNLPIALSGKEADSRGQRQPITRTYLDAKGRKELEKHYHQGIGLEGGFSMDFNYMGFQVGRSTPILYPGLAVNLILEPSWHLETGLKTSSRHQTIETGDDFEKVNLVKINPQYEDINKMEIDNRFVELPLILRYDLPVTSGLSISSGAGFTSYVFLKQEIEYSYPSTDSPSSDPKSSFRTDHVFKGPEVYLGGANVQMGFSNLLKNTNKIEGSIYFQKSIGKMGVEQTNGNVIGIKGAYIFTKGK